MTNARLEVLDGRGRSTTVVGRCRADARSTGAAAWELARTVVHGNVSSSDVLDELARRAGHASAVAEHVRLWLLGTIDRRT